MRMRRGGADAGAPEEEAMRTNPEADDRHLRLSADVPTRGG